MIVGTDKLLELLQGGLIEGLDENEINIEGCGIDVRIGELFEMEGGGGFLHKTERKTPTYKKIANYENGNRQLVTIEPGKYYVGKTVETINTPANLFGIFIPRGTFYASGIMIHFGRVDPGYKGNFRFHLANLTNAPFEIEMGARVANMIFLRVDGKTHSYIGQWQGGRAFIEKPETQTKQK